MSALKMAKAFWYPEIESALVEASQLGSVIKTVLDGGVPDHDAQIVVLHGFRGQLDQVSAGCGSLGSQEDSVGRGPTLHGESLPLSGAVDVVLDVVKGLRSFVDHKADGVDDVVVLAVLVKPGVDHIDLCLNLIVNEHLFKDLFEICLLSLLAHLRVSVSGLTDDHVGLELPDFFDKVDHVGSGFLPGSSSFLQIEVDSVHLVVVIPLSNFDGHLLGSGLTGQPVPGIGLDRVGVAT